MERYACVCGAEKHLCPDCMLEYIQKQESIIAELKKEITDSLLVKRRYKMRQDCFHYETCRLPVECCNKKCFDFFLREVTNKEQDSSCPSIWAITMECGHKTVTKDENVKSFFCTQCFKP